MSLQQQATEVLSLVATGNGSKGYCVTAAGAVAGANSSILGIADHNFLSGESVRVVTGQSAAALSGAAIDGVENRLMTNASGLLVPWTSTNTVAARLLAKPGNTATAAGQWVEVVIVRN